jgi:hypothetical protein
MATKDVLPKQAVGIAGKRRITDDFSLKHSLP